MAQLDGTGEQYIQGPAKVDAPSFDDIFKVAFRRAIILREPDALRKVGRFPFLNGFGRFGQYFNEFVVRAMNFKGLLFVETVLKARRHFGHSKKAVLQGRKVFQKLSFAILNQGSFPKINLHGRRHCRHC